jgi:hypothetical protein
MATAPGKCGIGSCLPGAVQVVSGGEATSISGSLPATLSAMRCARISSCERRNGDGRVYGDVVMSRLGSGRCWRHGQSTCHRTGSSGSIATTRCKKNWNHFVGACNEAARSARRNGKRKLRNDWAWNRPIGRPVVREKLASIKMSPKSKIARVEPPSHITNIGPVPLSTLPDLSRFQRFFGRSGRSAQHSDYPAVVAGELEGRCSLISTDYQCTVRFRSRDRPRAGIALICPVAPE